MTVNVIDVLKVRVDTDIVTLYVEDTYIIQYQKYFHFSILNYLSIIKMNKNVLIKS